MMAQVLRNNGREPAMQGAHWREEPAPRCFLGLPRIIDEVLQTYRSICIDEALHIP